MSDNLARTIEQALRSYRTQLWRDDACGDGLSLLDVLTPTGEDNIESGISEVELLADHVATELDDAGVLEILHWRPATDPPKESQLPLLLKYRQGNVNVAKWDGDHWIDLDIEICRSPEQIPGAEWAPWPTGLSGEI